MVSSHELVGQYLQKMSKKQAKGAVEERAVYFQGAFFVCFTFYLGEVYFSLVFNTVKC